MNNNLYTMNFEERRSVATEALKRASAQMKNALKNIDKAEEAIYLMRMQDLDNEAEKISGELAKLIDKTDMLRILADCVKQNKEGE